MTRQKLDELRELLLNMQRILDQALELLGAEDVDYEIIEGTMSTFGGPDDEGVTETEGLALCEKSEIDKFDEDLFLSEEEAGYSGLARRLNPDYVPGYIACRWDYDVTSREWLQTHRVSVRNPMTGKTIHGVQPIDWGPHEEKTGGRVADLSPALAERLELMTDSACEVRVPVPVVMV